MGASYNGAAFNANMNGVSHDGGSGGRVTSKTAPARLEQLDSEDDEDNILFKVLTMFEVFYKRPSSPLFLTL